MRTKISGLWLPLVTPFKDGAIDFASYERLIDHYIAQGVDGLFPLGTTGELPTVDDDEVDALVERTVAKVAGRVPVFVGVGGNATHKVEKALRR
ncbi:MAG TPA: dihydrodipicolinate synthase family protein, partial [Reyranella sp.]|nr:dihydrodipicolinate synthase family protein [Reyranella sp.]